MNTLLSNEKKPNIFGDKDLKIVFKRNMVSVDIYDCDFYNYFNSDQIEYINFFKQEIKRLETRNFDILKEYEFKRIGLNDTLKCRLKKIIYETYKCTIPIPFLNRLKKYNKKCFQLYYHIKTDSNTCEIILVDLYHLAIFAPDRRKKSKNQNAHDTYLSKISTNITGIEDVLK